MTGRALITWGGWDGHEPDQVAEIFRDILAEAGFAVAVADSLACLDEVDALGSYDLIVPVWTMSELSRERASNVSDAVARGAGLAGCHGGMCDAFRDNVLWQFMTGANWVAHPGGDGVRYRVKITEPEHELVSGLDDFDVEIIKPGNQFMLGLRDLHAVANSVAARMRNPVCPGHELPEDIVPEGITHAPMTSGKPGTASHCIRHVGSPFTGQFRHGPDRHDQIV